MPNNDSHQHVVKTTAQWDERAVEYWVVPRGCLCVELTPEGKTKLKVGEGNKYFKQLPYICDHGDLTNYYTKEEVDNLFDNLNRMAIMSTDVYESADDLPSNDNKLGDVRFVKSSTTADPDLYVWIGDRWIDVNSSDIDPSDFVTKPEFNAVKDKVDEIYPKAHTHANKDILDGITQADRDKFDDLHNYDDTELRELIARATHVHPNKALLDTITASSLWTTADRTKFDDLHNYDDTEVKVRLVAVEEKAHTHANKTVLDGITQEKLDAIDELAATYVIVTRDIADLKTKSHTHANKDLLDGTTASFTVEQQNELYRLSQISTFIGAGPTWSGVMGYVPAPEMGQQTYFLRADGTWAKVKSGGDKYKAGEGITILSGEVISDTFPFEIFPKADRVTQYVIYGTASGVGNLVSGHYEVPIKVSAPGHTDIIQTISLSDPLYDGDYIDFQRQVFVHYRTEVTSQITTDPSYSYKKAIYSDGVIRELDPGAYGDIPRVSRVYELMSGATYELTPWNVNGYSDFNRFRVGQYLNIYDADMNITRTLYQEHLGNTMIIVGENEKYMRMTVRQWKSGNVLTYQHLYRLYPMETPCALQALTLYPGVVNTIDVLTTNKPNEIYVEVEPSEDEPVDPDDPMSEYTGIIYNDGILDVTQEDPNNLNELTFHYRDDVDKTVTIPATPLPIASDTTLGGIKVGNNLTIDPVTGVLDATGGGTTYVEGDGIEFGRPILETYQVLDKIRKPSGTTLTTDVMPSGTVDFFCDLKYYKYAGDSFLILCYNGESGSFCYTPPVTNSSNRTRMWIYTGHEQWYDLYLNDSVQSSNPITAHLRWGTTMSISFDHTTRSAQNSPGVLPGHNLFKFDSSSDADLYWAKFYENSALVGELVPVIRQSDNVVGMFNKVTETFSTVSGLTAGTSTGEIINVYDDTSTQNIPINAKLGDGLSFDSDDAIEVTPATTETLGGIIVGDNLTIDENGVLSAEAGGTEYDAGPGIVIGASPSELYTQVEYLKSTGTQYIETDIVLDYTMRIVLDVKFGSTVLSSTKSVKKIFGYYNGGSTNTSFLAIWLDDDADHGNLDYICFYDGFRWVQGGPRTNELDDIDVTIRSTVVIQRGICSWGSATCTTLDSACTEPTPTTGTPIFAGFESNTYQIFGRRDMYLYSFKVYNSDSELIHNLVAVKRNTDDELGLYDLIGNKFYSNAGTGTFVAGSDIGPVPSNDQVISAKIGSGLQFDANGAIEAIGSGTQYVRVNTTDSYVLLHTKPADWDDHWDRYFELTYDEITTAPPDWDPTQHYKYENDNYVLGTAGDTFVSTTWYDKHYVGLDPTTAVTFDSDVYYTGELHLIEDGETYDTAFEKVNEAIEHIERLEGEVNFLHDEKIGVRTNSTPEQIEFYNT